MKINVNVPQCHETTRYLWHIRHSHLHQVTLIIQRTHRHRYIWKYITKEVLMPNEKASNGKKFQVNTCKYIHTTLIAKKLFALYVCKWGNVLKHCLLTPTQNRYICAFVHFQSKKNIKGQKSGKGKIFI